MKMIHIIPTMLEAAVVKTEADIPLWEAALINCGGIDLNIEVDPEIRASSEVMSLW